LPLGDSKLVCDCRLVTPFLGIGFYQTWVSSEMAKRLIPLLNRVLVEKVVTPSKSASDVLLSESSSKLNSGKVIVVGTPYSFQAFSAESSDFW